MSERGRRHKGKMRNVSSEDLRGTPGSTGKLSPAFTMLEILFVVLVIAVLSVIAIPNFLAAMTRSRVSRVRMELAGLKLAVGDYYMFYREYPPALQVTGREGESGSVGDAAPQVDGIRYPRPMGPAYPPANASAGAAPPPGFPLLPLQQPPGYDPWENFPSPLRVLTTPVAFLSHLPRDPFHKPGGVEDPGPYKYQPHAGEDGDGLRMDVPGHRGTFLFTLWSYGPDALPSTIFSPDLNRILPYDPSNGTISSGDLLLSGP